MLRTQVFFLLITIYYLAAEGSRSSPDHLSESQLHSLSVNNAARSMYRKESADQLSTTTKDFDMASLVENDGSAIIHQRRRPVVKSSDSSVEATRGTSVFGLAEEVEKLHDSNRSVESEGVQDEVQEGETTVEESNQSVDAHEESNQSVDAQGVTEPAVENQQEDGQTEGNQHAVARKLEDGNHEVADQQVLDSRRSVGGEEHTDTEEHRPVPMSVFRKHSEAAQAWSKKAVEDSEYVVKLAEKANQKLLDDREKLEVLKATPVGPLGRLGGTGPRLPPPLEDIVEAETNHRMAKKEMEKAEKEKMLAEQNVRDARTKAATNGVDVALSPEQKAKKDLEKIKSLEKEAERAAQKAAEDAAKRNSLTEETEIETQKTETGSSTPEKAVEEQVDDQEGDEHPDEEDV